MTNRAVLRVSEDSNEWMKLAACKGVDVNVFFPAPTDLTGIAIAKEFCSVCRVRKECLNFAISNEGCRATPGEDLGIYGMMTYDERRLFARRNRTRDYA